MVVGMDWVFKKNILNFVGVSLFDEIEVENLRMLGRYFKKDSVINLCRFEIVQFVDYILKYLKFFYIESGQ